MKNPHGRKDAKARESRLSTPQGALQVRTPEEIEEAKDKAEFEATRARNRREWAAIEAALLEWRQRGYR